MWNIYFNGLFEFKLSKIELSGYLTDESSNWCILYLCLLMVNR